MRLLQIGNCPLDPALGSGQTRLAWAAGLRALGHEVETLDSDALLGEARRQPRGRRWRLGWRAWRRLARTDLSAVDMIEFYGAEFWLPTLLLSRRRRRPLLVAHSDGIELLAAECLAAAERPPPAWKRAVEAPLMRAAFARADGVVAGSAADIAFVVARGLQPADRAVAVPLGLDEMFLAGDPLPLAKRENLIVFVGSWISRKGIAPLAEALGSLLRERPALRGALLGTGVEEKAVRRAFPPEVQERLEVRSRLGREEVRAALGRARVFTLPSAYEGFGLALAEAMARGCACVATPTGFGAEVLRGEEALVVSFGDAAALRAALSCLLDDPALATRLAVAGHRRVQALRWDASVRRLAETYETWLAA